MTTVPVYDAQGEKLREVEVDPERFDSQVRTTLLHEAQVAYLASLRQGSHSVKTRSTAQGGGAKPWRQKGTGRARHGSTRSPIWTGGGVAHGPHPRDYAYRLPTRQRRLALRSALRQRLEEEAVCVVEGLDDMAKPATKAVAGFLRSVGLSGRGVLLVNGGPDRNLLLSVRNLPKVDLVERRNLNAGQLLQRPRLVFTAAAFDSLVEEVTA